MHPRITEIDLRMAEISQRLKADDVTNEELETLSAEVGSLAEERSSLEKQIQRRGVLDMISGGAGTVVQRGTAQTSEGNGGECPEYRNAWLKRLMGQQLNDVEERAFSNTAGNGKEVVPIRTMNAIITKVRDNCPLLSEITLLNVRGGVRFAVENSIGDAAAHDENASITPVTDTLVEVTLGGFEIVKLVVVSDTIRTMSIDSFEVWLVEQIAEKVASCINKWIINGTGAKQATGIAKANTWDETNSITVAAAKDLAASDVLGLIALLKSGYDSAAKLLMSKKTFFTDFMPLQDNSKSGIITVVGRNYYVYGYPVMLCDEVALHDAYLCVLKKYVANMPESITINTAYDIDHNNYKYSGVAIFDGKPVIGEAFVKLTKAAA